jgi:hypothetical protein
MDDRSERLRRRRKQTSSKTDGERADGVPDPSEPSEPAEPSDPSKPDEPDRDPDRSTRDTTGASNRDDGSIPVKEQQTGTYMYLPETQVKRLRRQYNVLKAEYEFEYDEEFEKNRHFYPLVVQYGLERLDDLDTAQIRVRLEELYE